MDRSPGFGSTQHDLIALFRLAFASAPQLNCLTLPRSVTRRPVLQKVPSQAFPCGIALLVLGSIRFQFLFHSPPGVLFTFPSRYYFTIGQLVVFSLRRWSSRIHTGFLVSCATLDTAQSSSISVTWLLHYFAIVSTIVHLPS